MGKAWLRVSFFLAPHVRYRKLDLLIREEDHTQPVGPHFKEAIDKLRLPLLLLLDFNPFIPLCKKMHRIDLVVAISCIIIILMVLYSAHPFS